MRWFLLVTIAACGRIGFDPFGAVDSNGGGDEAGVALLSPCSMQQSAPDPLMVGGTAVRVTFAGGMSMEAGVTVEVFDASGAMLGQATSTAAGAYQVPVATGGKPIAASATLSKSGLVTTLISPDGATDHSLVDPATYVAQPGALTSIYLVGGLSQNMNKGTIGVLVRDCSGAVIEGATVTMSPMPEKIVYTNNLGIPSTGQTSTMSPYGLAIGLNAMPGTITVSAAKPGLSFMPHAAEVRSGNFLTDTAMHPSP